MLASVALGCGGVSEVRVALCAAAGGVSGVAANMLWSVAAISMSAAAVSIFFIVFFVFGYV